MEATESTTPVATTSTAPAAPATSAPVSSPAPSERPRTLQEAFARDAAAPSPSSAAASESPTTPAAETRETPAVSPDPSATSQGPIPFEVHKTALENREKKVAERLQAEFDQQYGWAKQIPQEQIQAWAGMAEKMTADPIAFLNEFTAELRAHPTYGPQLRSAAARTLASRQPTELAPPEPDVAITDADGRVVGRTYSDQALAKRDDWLIQRVVAQMQGEYGPLKQHVEAQQKAVRDAAEYRQHIESLADATVAEIQEITEGNADAIQAYLKVSQAHPDWSPRKAALAARDEVLVMPKATAKAVPQVVSDLKTKAAASTVNPAGTAVTTPRRPASLLDPSLSWA